MAKVLLVEDNEMNRDMLSRRLFRRGHEVVIAEDGLAGLEHNFVTGNVESLVDWARARSCWPAGGCEFVGGRPHMRSTSRSDPP